MKLSCDSFFLELFSSLRAELQMRKFNLPLLPSSSSLTHCNGTATHFLSPVHLVNLDDIWIVKYNHLLVSPVADTMKVAVPWNHVTYSCKKSRGQITWNHYESRDLSVSGTAAPSVARNSQLTLWTEFWSISFPKIGSQWQVGQILCFILTHTFSLDPMTSWTSWLTRRLKLKKWQNILRYSLQSVTYTNCKINRSRLIS